METRWIDGTLGGAHYLCARQEGAATHAVIGFARPNLYGTYDVWTMRPYDVDTDTDCDLVCGGLDEANAVGRLWALHSRGRRMNPTRPPRPEDDPEWDRKGNK